MSFGLFLPGVDPDTVYKKLVEEVHNNGSSYNDKYILPTTSVKCYAGKRYLTTTGVNLPYIFEAVFRLIIEPANLGYKVKDLFNAGRDTFLVEGRSVMAWFGFADVYNNTLNFTITLRDVDVVNDYGGMYTYYFLLMELVASVTGFRMGSITFFFNNVHMSTKDGKVYENLKNIQPYSYKTNTITAQTYDYLTNCAKYALDMWEEYNQNPGKDFDLSVVTDICWRDLLAVMMFQIKIDAGDYVSAKNCVDLLDSYSYEWLWCMKKMEGVVEHVNT